MTSSPPEGPHFLIICTRELGFHCENLGVDSSRQGAIDLSETQAQDNLPVLLGLQPVQCMSQPSPCANASFCSPSREPWLTQPPGGKGSHGESLKASSLVKTFILVSYSYLFQVGSGNFRQARSSLQPGPFFLSPVSVLSLPQPGPSTCCMDDLATTMFWNLFIIPLPHPPPHPPLPISTHRTQASTGHVFHI